MCVKVIASHRWDVFLKLGVYVRDVNIEFSQIRISDLKTGVNLDIDFLHSPTSAVGLLISER